MEDIGLIMDVLNKEKGNPPDDEIERRLQDFHRRHADRRPISTLQKIGIGLGIAASIALAFILVKPLGTSQDSIELQLGENGIVAQSGNDEMTASSQKEIPVSLDERTHEQKIDSKELSRFFANTDTIKLNVSRGHSCKVVLPDGSCAYLHPGTKMVYPKAFDGLERRVRLEGEAYFVIHKDKKHPFIVTTANSETLVTGTEFNVNTGGANNPGTQVTLINGSVQLSNKLNQQKVFLSPGEEATIMGGHPISVCEADTMAFVAWRDGYFYFDHTTLENILQKICQSYGVRAVYSDSKLGNYRMHFTLRRDQDLKEAIDMLNKMKKVKVSLMYGKLYIQERR